ncbi:MAG: TlpA family protein disulfide reductase [Gammaproteobacteria bacterium]|nr:TlpA family protein disulfide reductase [Gammaproteobacteria bacterium]
MFDRRLLIAAGVALLMGLAGGYWFRQGPGLALDSRSAAQPGFRLPDLEGRMRQPDDWLGQVVVLNFWASWCPPCVKEMPEFAALQSEYGERGVQFVGIASEPDDAARAFLQKTPVNYPILLGNLDAISIAQAYGNSMGALPFTVFIGRDGQIAARRPGGLSRAQTEGLIAELL